MAQKLKQMSVKMMEIFVYYKHLINFQIKIHLIVKIYMKNVIKDLNLKIFHKVILIRLQIIKIIYNKNFYSFLTTYNKKIIIINIYNI